MYLAIAFAIQLFVLFNFVVCTLAEEIVPVYDLGQYCSGKKQVLKINHGSAIFSLNENFQTTYKILRNRDIECHFELETFSNNYGFNIHIDEMKIDSNHRKTEEVRCHGVNGFKYQCNDYVQFSRDVLFVNTYESCKYCGYREKINYETATFDDYNRMETQGKRAYKEASSDGEMDIWFKIKQSGAGRNNYFNRTLRVVATVFKKSCKGDKSSWVECENTNQCIKKNFICDRNPNCISPQNNRPTDELKCNGYIVNTEGIGKRSFASRIPVIIIVTVIGVGCLVLIFIVLRRCFKVYRVFQQPSRPKPSDDEESGVPLRTVEPSSISNQVEIREGLNSNPSRSRSHSNAVGSEIRLEPRDITVYSSQQNHELNEPNISPSDINDRADLPTYEEAVQSPYVPNIHYADDNIERDNPPPYSPADT